MILIILFGCYDVSKEPLYALSGDAQMIKSCSSSRFQFIVSSTRISQLKILKGLGLKFAYIPTTLYLYVL